MNVTIGDISRRSKAKINTNKSSKSNISYTNLYNDKGKFLESNAFNMLYNWTELDEDTNIAFNKVLDVFSEICINCNEAKINNACDFLLQEVNKVRDAVHLQNSIKHKTSRLKTKITTKIQNKVDSASNALANPLANIQNETPSFNSFQLPLSVEGSLQYIILGAAIQTPLP